MGFSISFSYTGDVEGGLTRCFSVRLGAHSTLAADLVDHFGDVAGFGGAAGCLACYAVLPRFENGGGEGEGDRGEDGGGREIHLHWGCEEEFLCM